MTSFHYYMCGCCKFLVGILLFSPIISSQSCCQSHISNLEYFPEFKDNAFVIYLHSVRTRGSACSCSKKIWKESSGHSSIIKKESPFQESGLSKHFKEGDLQIGAVRPEVRLGSSKPQSSLLLATH